MRGGHCSKASVVFNETMCAFTLLHRFNKFNIENKTKGL